MKLRRATLRYEIFDEEEGRWVTKFKSINPDKKRQGNNVPLKEQEIWVRAEEYLKSVLPRSKV